MQTAVKRLLPDEVAVACSDPKAPGLPLFPQEAAAIRYARPARVMEFTAGRNAARTAMRANGLRPQPVPMGDDRAPIWPKGMVGSIAHDHALCLAVIGASHKFRSLSVDLEPDTDLPADILPEICSQPELTWLATQPAGHRGRLAKRIFSAKECAYKCQYPLTGEMLDFHDFAVVFSPDQSQFIARFQRPVGDFATGAGLHGHCLSLSGHILSLMTLTAAGCG